MAIRSQVPAAPASAATQPASASTSATPSFSTAQLGDILARLPDDLFEYAASFVLLDGKRLNVFAIKVGRMKAPDAIKTCLAKERWILARYHAGQMLSRSPGGGSDYSSNDLALVALAMTDSILEAFLFWFNQSNEAKMWLALRIRNAVRCGCVSVKDGRAARITLKQLLQTFDIQQLFSAEKWFKGAKRKIQLRQRAKVLSPTQPIAALLKQADAHDIHALFVDVGWKKAYSHIDAVTVLDCEGKMANPNALRVKRPLLSFESCSTICAINDKKQIIAMARPMHADADSLVTVKNGAPGDIPPGLGKPAKFDVFWHSLQKHLGHGDIPLVVSASSGCDVKILLDASKSVGEGGGQASGEILKCGLKTHVKLGQAWTQTVFNLMPLWRRLAGYIELPSQGMQYAATYLYSVPEVRTRFVPGCPTPLGGGYAETAMNKCLGDIQGELAIFRFCQKLFLNVHQAVRGNEATDDFKFIEDGPVITKEDSLAEVVALLDEDDDADPEVLETRFQEIISRRWTNRGARGPASLLNLLKDLLPADEGTKKPVDKGISWFFE